MKIYYVNSQGRKLDLITYPYLMLTDTDLFDYAWSNTTKGTVRPRISSFSRSMVTKKFSVRVKGTSEENYRYNIEYLTSFFDADVLKLSPGRLYVDNYYLDCYIYSSSKPSKYLEVLSTTVDFTLVSPDGNWKTSNIFHYDTRQDKIDGNTGQSDTNMLDYPYDYIYDYTNSITSRSINNDGYADSDFEITIYGKCENPVISIGDWNYGVNDVELLTGEKLIINSATKKVYKVKNNGDTVNLFNNRFRDFYAFKKISAGISVVGWNGAYSFDVELFENRSEPKWT